MATYIQGITGYIPQIQQFKPDFNFYNQALQFKQSKYDIGHEQLSNVYGSLLNAPLLRDGNIKTRDKFFKTIDQDIKKMAGMDLSLQQNVDAASGVFNQLLDNKNLVKDMVWTKNWQKEQQRAENFRDCINPEKCGGSWWEGGVKALNYYAEDFRNASDNEAMGMGNVTFTPYQDMMTDAIKLAKDAGLSITVDQLQGGYITTTKNGPALVGPLSNLFMGKFGNDPKYLDYYKTKAFVDRNDWINSNIPVYGSKEASSAAFLEEATMAFKSQVEPVKKELTRTTTNVSAQKKQLEEKIKKEGTTPDGDLAEQYRILNQYESEYKDSLNVINDADGSLRVASSKTISNSSLGYLDNALAMMYMSNDIEGAAQVLSMKDYEFSMTADPYGLESVKHANQMAFEDKKFQNDWQLEAFKQGLVDMTGAEIAKGTIEDNVPQVIESKGATSIGDFFGLTNNILGDQSGYEMYQENKEAIKVDITAPEKEIIQDAFTLIRNKSRAENGEGMASQDLVSLTDLYYKEMAKQENYGNDASPFNTDYIKARTNLNKWENASDVEKLKIAQGLEFSELGKLPNQVIENIYNNNVSKLIDFNNQTNRVNRDYLLDVKNKNDKYKPDILAKKISLEKLEQFEKDVNAAIISQMYISPDTERYAPLMEFYINPETGKPRDAVEFATMYADSKADRYAPKLELPTTIPNTFQDNTINPNFQNALQAVKTINNTWSSAYNEALSLYRNDKPLQPSNWERTTNAITNTVKIAGTAGIGLAFFDIDGPTTEKNKSFGGAGDQGLHDIYRRMFTKYASLKGGDTHLGVSGSGSKSAQALYMENVDFAKYKSGNVINTMSFLNNYQTVPADARKVAMGGFGFNIPETDSEAGIKLLNTLMTDINQKANVKTEDRPMVNVTYQDIAGNSSNWTAMNIKPTGKYLESLVGTSKKPGPYFMFSDVLASQGVTTYIKKENATNGFRQHTKKTAVDLVLEYNKEYKFDSFPEATSDLRLIKLEGGGYVVTGTIKDNDGNDFPFEHPYSAYRRTETIVQEMNAALQKISIDNKNAAKINNAGNLIKDPSKL